MSAADAASPYPIPLREPVQHCLPLALEQNRRATRGGSVTQRRRPVMRWVPNGHNHRKQPAAQEPDVLRISQPVCSPIPDQDRSCFYPASRPEGYLSSLEVSTRPDGDVRQKRTKMHQYHFHLTTGSPPITTKVTQGNNFQRKSFMAPAHFSWLRRRRGGASPGCPLSPHRVAFRACGHARGFRRRAGVLPSAGG